MGRGAGTVLVKALGGVHSMASAGGKLFFRGATPSVGNQPYGSDGTGIGTVVLRADLLLPGNAATFSGFTDVGGTVFFAANDGLTGLELWRSKQGA